MSSNKTQVTDVSVEAFLQTIDHPVRSADARILVDLFADVTGDCPRMWGPSIIGYGQYANKYESGRAGVSLATGFSPRKSNVSIYIMPGYQDYGDILERLGKHKMGKSCLYVNKLADIDLCALRDLIKTGLRDLNKLWPVSPSSTS